MLEDCTFSNRPKCIALVGLPFVGTTEVAETLEKAKETVKKIEAAMDSCTAPCLAIDDLLTDNETYAAYVEALGGPPVNVVYLTCSDEALEAKKVAVAKDDGDLDETTKAHIEAVKKTLDMTPDENGGAPT